MFGDFQYVFKKEGNHRITILKKSLPITTSKTDIECIKLLFHYHESNYKELLDNLLISFISSWISSLHKLLVILIMN